MKNAHPHLVHELLLMLNEQEKTTCQRIIHCLTELGYVPERQKVQGYVLSFKNKKVNQTIAKVGVKNGKDVSYSIKFYACKNPAPKFCGAIRDIVLKSKEQYKCSDCGVCGVDKEVRGYHYTYPNGREFIRCGTYLIEIPDLMPDDIDDFTSLIAEQHAYFLAREKQAAVRR